MTDVKIEEVMDFWSSHPCDSDRSRDNDRRTYFADIEQWRYAEHPSIPEAASFSDFAGKDVLEIGCGVGTDGRQFMLSGARYTGINLDEGSTRLATEAIAVFGLDGSVKCMNGEDLQFDDGSFDHVYIMGVLMATPRPERMLAEAHRVLRPGGTVCAMVYNRDSINYRIEIMGLRRWGRYVLLVPGLVPILVRMGFSRELLERHRELVQKHPWMSGDEWINVNTDGPDCPLSGVYSAVEVHDLFTRADFVRVRTFVRFFNRHHYGSLGRLLPASLGESIGRRWGWHRWVWAQKPPVADGL